uniref:Uncharacterized protein n=1 Tax=Setaria viridis TaxID=4556 RepID=A0A4U6UFS0_SETVI|nr:hypothetical protein SEVIR_5G103200v2 [Setaria viridis]
MQSFKSLGKSVPKHTRHTLQSAAAAWQGFTSEAVLPGLRPRQDAASHAPPPPRLARGHAPPPAVALPARAPTDACSIPPPPPTATPTATPRAPASPTRCPGKAVPHAHSRFAQSLPPRLLHPAGRLLYPPMAPPPLIAATVPRLPSDPQLPVPAPPRSPASPGPINRVPTPPEPPSLLALATR